MRQTSSAIVFTMMLNLILIGIANAQQPSPLPPTLSVLPTQTLTLVANAKGVQIYICSARTDNGKVEWILKAPEANLYNSSGTLIGKHFAGPSWEANDGSKVVGVVKAKVEQEKSIPWLLLGASANSGTGVFAHTTAIQRLNTADGKAPPDGCDSSLIGTELRVPYTAQYYFYD
jgi:hypothetical protein